MLGLMALPDETQWVEFKQELENWLRYLLSDHADFEYQSVKWKGKISEFLQLRQLSIFRYGHKLYWVIPEELKQKYFR